MKTTLYGFHLLTEARAFVEGVTLVNDSAIRAYEPVTMTTADAKVAVAGIGGDARVFQWRVKVVDKDGEPDE